MRQGYGRLGLITGVLAAALNAGVTPDARARLFVFGDSYSDTGNVDAVTEGFAPGSEYFQGRFTNGPLWVDLIADDMSVRLGLAPGLDGLERGSRLRSQGYNFAHAGSTAAERAELDDYLSLENQIDFFSDRLASRRIRVTRNDVATVWAGTNDYVAYDVEAPEAPVAGVMSAVTQLAQTRVGRVLVFNVPRFGDFPGWIDSDQRDVFNARVDAHNALLEQSIEALVAKVRRKVFEVDVAGLFEYLQSAEGSFAVTRPGEGGSLTGNCLGDGLVLAACPENYLFYDYVHPTASGHAAIAALVEEVLWSVDSVALQERATMQSGARSAGYLLEIVNKRFVERKAGPEAGFASYALTEQAQDRQSESMGADWIGNGWMIGATMTASSISQDTEAAHSLRSDAELSGIAAYASHSDGAWRLEAMLIQEHGQLDTERTTLLPNGLVALGQTEIDQSGASLGLHHAFSLGAWQMSAGARMTALSGHADGYEETGTFGLSNALHPGYDWSGVIGAAELKAVYGDADRGLSVDVRYLLAFEGDVSYWTHAPVALQQSRSEARSGVSVWSTLWLARPEQFQLQIEGGVLADQETVDGAARITAAVQF